MGEITPLQTCGLQPEREESGRPFSRPTSKARSSSSRPLPSKRCREAELADVAPGAGTDLISEELEVVKVFDPEVVRPTQWLAKLLDLPPEERNAFVVAWVIEKVGETLLTEGSLDGQRWSDIGIEVLLKSLGPRKAIQVAQSATSSGLVDAGRVGVDVGVSATVAMIGGIDKSAKCYASGIRAYGSFCTLLGRTRHFPATEELAMGFHFFFSNAAPYMQYLKHLRFAHHLFRLDVAWYTRSVKQVEKGISKLRLLPRPKPSLKAEEAKKIMRASYVEGDVEFSVICCVARLFMLCVPSECLPLEIQGEHSSVAFKGLDVYF